MADQVFNGDLAREYVPNADAADQNATADPLSILSLLTLIGTDTAVITLPGVKGTATVYTVGSNSDFASSYPNVTFKVLSGAVIAHGAYTLKLHLEAGQYQVFDGTGAVTLVNADKILPRWFGALGDGATDDIVPIRKAFASQAASQVAYLANATNYVFSVPVVAFDNSHWEISDAITPGSQAMRIRGNWAILRLTDGTKNFFECSVAYRIEHEGMTFVGGNSVFNFGNDNLGPAWIYGKDNEYTWGGGNSGAVFNFYLPGITVNLSVNLVIENSSFLYNYQILNSQPGADATFRTNWFIGTNPIAAVAQFVNRSNLTLDNFQGSPSAGACPLGARWVDNYGSFNAVNATRFGSEGNGMPIVYN